MEQKEDIHTFTGDIAILFRNIKKLLKILLQVIISIVLILLIVWAFASIYFAWTDSGKVVIYEKCGKLYLNPTAYYLSADKRYIISTTLDHQINYRECGIIDIENWECKYPDKDIPIKMVDGVLETDIKWNQECKQIEPIKYYMGRYFDIGE